MGEKGRAWVEREWRWEVQAARLGEPARTLSGASLNEPPGRTARDDGRG